MACNKTEVGLLKAKIKQLEGDIVKLSNGIIKLSKAIIHQSNAIENLNKALLTALDTQGKILKLVENLKIRVLKLEQQKSYKPKIPPSIKMPKKDYIS